MRGGSMNQRWLRAMKPNPSARELTYSRDVADIKVIEKTIRELAEDVGRRLRQEELGATTVKIKIRWPDFSTQTRQVSFPRNDRPGWSHFSSRHAIV